MNRQIGVLEQEDIERADWGETASSPKEGRGKAVSKVM